MVFKKVRKGITVSVLVVRSKKGKIKRHEVRGKSLKGNFPGKW